MSECKCNSISSSIGFWACLLLIVFMTQMCNVTQALKGIKSELWHIKLKMD